MKKVLTVLVLCLMCAFCAVEFTACDFSTLKNSVNEIINGQTQDEENKNEEKGEEEKIVINQYTDFNALESDKVEKDVFINAFVFFARSVNPYTTAKINCTVMIEENNNGLGVLKFDKLDRSIIQGVQQDENVLLRYDHIIMSEDMKSCIQYGQQGGGEISEIFVDTFDSSFLETPEELVEIKEISEKLWENAVYNETTKQYEVSHIIRSDHMVWDNVQIKIKDEHVVFLEATTTDGQQAPQIERAKCYDFGTTKIGCPYELINDDQITLNHNIQNLIDKLQGNGRLIYWDGWFDELYISKVDNGIGIDEVYTFDSETKSLILVRLYYVFTLEDGTYLTINGKSLEKDHYTQEDFTYIADTIENMECSGVIFLDYQEGGITIDIPDNIMEIYRSYCE